RRRRGVRRGPALRRRARRRLPAVPPDDRLPERLRVSRRSALLGLGAVGDGDLPVRCPQKGAWYARVARPGAGETSQFDGVEPGTGLAPLPSVAAGVRVGFAGASAAPLLGAGPARARGGTREEPFGPQLADAPAPPAHVLPDGVVQLPPVAPE